MVAADGQGARRKPLDIETITGVLHHYSFERLGQGVWFSVARAGRCNGRSVATRAALLLFGRQSARAYIASDARGRRNNERGGIFGLGGSVGLAAFALALSFIPYLGPLFWGLGVVGMMVITIVEFRSDRPKRAPLAGNAPPGPNVRVIIRADESATDEETEGEAAAETAERTPALRRRDAMLADASVRGGVGLRNPLSGVAVQLVDETVGRAAPHGGTHSHFASRVRRPATSSSRSASCTSLGSSSSEPR